MSRYIYPIFAAILLLSIIAFRTSSDSAAQVTTLSNPNEIEFSHPPGEYSESIKLNINIGCVDGIIAVTLDGSEPDVDNPTNLALPLDLSINHPVVTVIKAKAQCPNHSPTETIQGSYILGVPHDNPIISIIVDPIDLHDSDIGLLAEDNYKERGSEWERDVHLTLVDNNDSVDFNAGVRIHGNFSRIQDKKSLRIYLREAYGSKYLNYPLLGADVTPTRYKRFVLSNGGQDNSGQSDEFWSPRWTLIRTQVTNTLAKEIGLPTTSSRPINLFINGQPQGIYIARNYINKHFFRDKYGYDEVDEMEPYSDEEREWGGLRTILETYDFRENESVSVLGEKIDLEQLIDYYIFQMYLENRDWISNNYKMFQIESMMDGSEPDDRWQFMLWDVEYGFNGGPTYESTRNLNMFDYIYDEFEKADSKVLGDKLILALFENENFRTQFLQRMTELLNTTLSSENVSNHITVQKEIIEGDIATEILRWGSRSSWEQNINYLHEFAKQRPEAMRENARLWEEGLEK